MKASLSYRERAWSQKKNMCHQEIHATPVPFLLQGCITEYYRLGEPEKSVMGGAVNPTAQGAVARYSLAVVLALSLPLKFAPDGSRDLSKSQAYLGGIGD